MSLKPKIVDFDQTWSKLLETVRGVITCGAVNRRVWNDRFSDVYALCVAWPEPLGDRLYNETKSFLEGHITGLSAEVQQQGRGEENLLASYHKHWEGYSSGSTYLNLLYGYLNSQFIKSKKFSDADMVYGGFDVPPEETILEIGELALDTWKRILITPMKDVLLKLLLEEIKQDRLQQSVNQSVVHGVIISLVNVEEYKKKRPLQLYEEMFESPFLEETSSYYQREAKQLLADCTCSEYMEKVIQKLSDENLRSRKFLNASSYVKVTHKCEERLVSDNLSVLHAECRHMVEKEVRSDLSHMYTLLKPIQGGLTRLIEEQEKHVKHLGLEAVKTLHGDSVQIASQFVENILEVYNKQRELINVVYYGDQLFIGALDRACAAVVNHRDGKHPCKSPELLAKYCDHLLKKSSKGMSESEVDDKLTSSITVFKFLDDKDVYQRFYSRMLARRLIYHLSVSMDAEESMINKLKQACGYEFTNKLHRMFTDMNISTDLQNKFNNFIKGEKEELGINFSILVLQAGAWPLGQSSLPAFSVPQELETSARLFEKFYNKNFNGRKLTWMHNYCNGELKFNSLKKTYFVTVGSFHMALLLVFNNSETATFKELGESTQLADKELMKQLQTLVETKIILAQDSKPVTSNSILVLNTNYTNKRTKFKITATIQKESPHEVEQTHTAVDEDRKLYIQAAIVRIMKARKISKHNLLIQEVISQARARFSPSVSMIKKCIEALIDKQYLERTPQNTDEYSYVA